MVSQMPLQEYLPLGVNPPTCLDFAPSRDLLQRARAELPADFNGPRPLRLSRAPARLDVIGGLGEYAGGAMAQLTLDRGASVLLSERHDRVVQVFSFNLHDEHQPFTLRIPLEALARTDAYHLRVEFSQPGRRFGAYVAGCLYVLHHQGLIDLNDPDVAGLNLAVLSNIPMNAGLASSSAVEVATMVNLIDHFNARWRVGPLELAQLCQKVENELVGVPCGVSEPIACLTGEPGKLAMMFCQPHNIQDAIALPEGVRVVGVNTYVHPAEVMGQCLVTRCASFMAHAIIFDRMRIMGESMGRQLIADPMAGYLANVDPEDYKRLFRDHLPAYMPGEEFLRRYGKTIDPSTRIDPAIQYPVQHAADHHILEHRRVKNFVQFLQKADTLKGLERKFQLDKAGHLMYASHLSYTNDAMLGSPECDLLVRLVRDNEGQGLFGARMTAQGAGGTVAILAETSDQADQALDRVCSEYTRLTGKPTDLFKGASPGGWNVPTVEVRN
jgi:L-arabinokinase